jgi:hypothetical protein
MGDQTEKVRENRIRRAAERQGLALSKSRRRDPRALDYGVYRLRDGRGGVVLETTDPGEVEAYLRGERNGS